MNEKKQVYIVTVANTNYAVVATSMMNALKQALEHADVTNVSVRRVSDIEVEGWIYREDSPHEQ